MKVQIFAMIVVGLLMECAKAEEEQPTVEELKKAAEKLEGDISCVQQDCSCAFRSRTCCCANKDLLSVKEEVSETFKDISGRIHQLLDDIREVTVPVNVAFTAFLKHKARCLGPFERNVSIRYNDIRLNEGSGYSSVLGLFTAPVSGVYSFSLSVYSRVQWVGQHMFHKVQLMRNGQAEVAMWEDNTEDMEDSTSHRVLLSLKQGDQVYAELVHDRQLCGNIRGLNSFSGYLVYPQPLASF